MSEILSFDEYITESAKEYMDYKELRKFIVNISKYMEFGADRFQSTSIHIPSSRNSSSIAKTSKQALEYLDKFYKIYKDDNPQFYIWSAAFLDRKLEKKVKKVMLQKLDIKDLMKVAKENPGQLYWFTVGFDSAKQDDFAKQMSSGRYGKLD